MKFNSERFYVWNSPHLIHVHVPHMNISQTTDTGSSHTANLHIHWSFSVLVTPLGTNATELGGVGTEHIYI